MIWYDFGSLSPTMAKVRAPKDALYKSEENLTERKGKAELSRNSPDNDSPPAKVSQCHPGMWWQPDYSGSQGDAGWCQQSV